MNVLLKSVLRQFPPVEFVFAYGSGVLRQEGRDLVNTVVLGVRELPSLSDNNYYI